MCWVLVDAARSIENLQALLIFFLFIKQVLLRAHRRKPVSFRKSLTSKTLILITTQFITAVLSTSGNFSLVNKVKSMKMTC